MSDRMVKVIITNKSGDVLDEIRIPVDPETDSQFTPKSEMQVSDKIRDWVEHCWEVDHSG